MLVSMLRSVMVSVVSSRSCLPVVAVTDAIRRSDYAAFGIDGADFVETPDGDWYEVELEDGRDREVTLRVTAEGAILKR